MSSVPSPLRPLLLLLLLPALTLSRLPANPPSSLCEFDSYKITNMSAIHPSIRPSTVHPSPSPPHPTPTRTPKAPRNEHSLFNLFCHLAHVFFGSYGLLNSSFVNPNFQFAGL